MALAAQKDDTLRGMLPDAELIDASGLVVYFVVARTVLGL